MVTFVYVARGENKYCADCILFILYYIMLLTFLLTFKSIKLSYILKLCFYFLMIKAQVKKISIMGPQPMIKSFDRH